MGARSWYIGVLCAVAAGALPAVAAAEPVSCAEEDPIACWRLGEVTGTVAADASGNGHHGTYFGAPALGQPGVFASDTAVLFDGVDDHVRVPDDDGLDVGSHFTAEAWIKRSSATKTHQLFNKGDKSLHLAVMAGTGQVFVRKANVTTIARTEGGVPADGEWHHVAATMHGAGTAVLYIDGVADTVQVAPTQSLLDNAAQLILGGTATTSYVLDELALYDGALDAEDIAEHAGVDGGEEPPLNVEPTLSTASAEPSRFVEGGPAVVVDPFVLVDDPDSLTLSGARVTSSSTLPSDLLTFTDTNGAAAPNLNATLSTATEIVLEGEATPAAYQAALREVRYSSSADFEVQIVRSFAFNATDAEGAAATPLVRTVTLQPAAQPVAP